MPRIRTYQKCQSTNLSYAIAPESSRHEMVDTEPFCRRPNVLRAAVLAAAALALLALGSFSPSAGQRRFPAVSPHLATHGEDVGVDRNAAVKVVDASRFGSLVAAAQAHARKRKMSDLTQSPETNSLQVLLNTWTEGSLSPVHSHPKWSETFVCLDGALALFTFSSDGAEATCTVLSSGGKPALVAEAGTWHAMASAPRALGWPGHAVILELSGHLYRPTNSKLLAPFAPSLNDGLDGEPAYFEHLFSLCPRAGKRQAIQP